MNRLKECRESMGYSQKYVAISLGVSAPTVCDWELDKKHPSQKNLRKLSEFYGKPIDYLLGNDLDGNQPTAQSRELDEELVNLLTDLSPGEVQRVQDFVSGLKASRAGEASPRL